MSDNARLAARGNEESDLILSVTPTIAVKKDGARLKVRGSYSPWLITYVSGTGSNSVANTLNSIANLEAIDNFMYVDARANIFQSFLSPFGAQPADYGTATSNRTEVTSLGLSPYIRGRLRNGSQYTLRDDVNYTTFSSGNRPDLMSNAVIAAWNGVGERLIVPSVEYNRNTTKFGVQPAFLSELARARATLNVDPELQVFASGGYENTVSYTHLTLPTNREV